MKLMRVVIQNFKGIEYAEIEFPDDVTVISGENRAGKTSLLDAIVLTLGGSKAEEYFKVPDPIKNGEDVAEVEIFTNDDYIISKKWYRGKSPVLTIKSSKGAKYPSPQGLINQFLGLFVDPMAYAGMKDKEFSEIVATQAGILEKLVSYKMQYDAIFADRQAINREFKKAKSLIEDSREPLPNLPDKPISLSDLATRLEEANRMKTEHEKKVKEHERLKEEFKQLKESIRLREEELERLKITLQETADKGTQLGKEIQTDAIGLIDVQTIIDEMSTIEERNKEINYAINFAKLQVQASDLFEQSEELTNTLENIKAERLEAIQNAELPIPGLSFDDEGNVTYNGVIFSQLSEEEKASVSAAISIANKAPEKLEVLILRNAGGFTETSLQRYIEVAKANNYQVIIERPGVLEFGIVVENGKIK